MVILKKVWLLDNINPNDSDSGLLFQYYFNDSIIEGAYEFYFLDLVNFYYKNVETFVCCSLAINVFFFIKEIYTGSVSSEYNVSEQGDFTSSIIDTHDTNINNGVTLLSASYARYEGSYLAKVRYNTGSSYLLDETGLLVDSNDTNNFNLFNYNLNVLASDRLTNIKLTSNNQNPSYAKSGDTITLSFESIIAITSISVNIYGNSST